MGAAEAAAAARQSAVNDARESVGSLTARPREIAVMLIKGYSTERIALETGCTNHTVIEHTQRIRAKMDSMTPWQTGYLLALGGLRDE